MQAPRRDALLLTTTGLAALLLSPLLLLKHDTIGAMLKGYLLTSPVAAVRVLDHGESIEIRPGPRTIIRCPSQSPDALFLDPRRELAPSGGEIQEWNDQEQRTFGRSASYNSGDLAQFAPDNMYLIRVNKPTSIRCSQMK